MSTHNIQLPDFATRETEYIHTPAINIHYKNNNNYPDSTPISTSDQEICYLEDVFTGNGTDNDHQIQHANEIEYEDIHMLSNTDDNENESVLTGINHIILRKLHECIRQTRKFTKRWLYFIMALNLLLTTLFCMCFFWSLGYNKNLDWMPSGITLDDYKHSLYYHGMSDVGATHTNCLKFDPPINRNHRLLCEIMVNQMSSHCKSSSIADNIDQLIAVAPIYAMNQHKHSTLYSLHVDFVNYMKSFGVRTIVIEGIYNPQEQEFIVTHANKEPFEIQVVLEDGFYQRENLINVAAYMSLDYWEYLVWIDAHQWFENPYWWEEAIYKMEHHKIIQLFTGITYLKPDNRTQFWNGTANLYYFQYVKHKYNVYGNAWGVRKEIYLQMQSIEDKCIAGGCDVILSYALVPDGVDIPHFGKLHPYYSQFFDWMREIDKIIQKDTAFIRGKLMHYSHERFFNYVDIMEHLSKIGFLLNRDLSRDDKNVLYIHNKTIKDMFSVLKPY